MSKSLVYRFIVTLSWPRGCLSKEAVESDVLIEGPSAEIVLGRAKSSYREHDVLLVTKAELQPDGRWTLPKYQESQWLLNL